MRSSLLTKRMDFLETWFDALMLAFKLPVVILPVWLLVWYAFLPPFQAQPTTDYYASFLRSPADDFAAIAFQLGLLLFLPAGVLVIGGLIQLFCHSLRSAGWSLGFGVFALIIAIVLACADPTERPDRGVENVLNARHIS